MEIYKPSEQDLQHLLDEATKNQTAEQWLEKFLSNLKEILLKNPSRYRNFGPYWWALKKVYIDKGDLSFGEFVDAEWLEKMDYRKPELNVIAAFNYEEMRTTTNMLDDPFHTLESADGGDSIEYALSDPDMELMGIGA